ncbi:MAG: DEAD/DEAH box helicase family protein, partial [Candidatus Saccharibacteria bacterium]
CEALYAAPARMRPEENYVKSVRLNLDITFSLAQYEAFEALARFVRKDSFTECLVWEACGAGRPETVFGAVREVLKRGGKVLFGVPRRDILDDLFGRLERAFPGVNVAARYGRPKVAQRSADIILASTHHTLTFYKSFDLVILDESDAFPYRANPILINALRRAKKNDGKFIYMTPTPNPEVYVRAQRGEMKVVQIPIRQHGHPLVLPQVVNDKELAGDRLSETVYQLVRENIEEDHAQVLIVVPDSYRSTRVGQWLISRMAENRTQGPKDDMVAYTNSHDPERDRKVAAYFRGEYHVLVTTNLTSRGDRAPHSNMIVLWADNELFDEGCLLQLAGRVGWSEAYPKGKVWFVASTMTRDMEGAIRKIKLLNEEAQKKGYLDNIKEKQNNVKF